MSDGAAMLLQCANCSAPLPPPAHGEIDLVCHYCGGTTRISDPKAHADEPRRERHQEEHREPSRESHERQKSDEAKKAREDSASTKKTRRSAIAIPVVIVGVVAIVVGLRLQRGRIASFPLTCGNVDDLTISNRTFDGTGPAVVASKGCKVTIQDSTLKADQIVKADSDAGDVTITIVRSKLEARGVAIDVKGKGHLKISDKSDVYGAGGAVVGDGLMVSVQDSVLRGDDVIARCAELTSANAAFEGKQTGLIVSIVTLRQSHVTADVGVICESTFDFKVTLDASTIDAKSVGVNATAGNLRLSSKSLVKGGTTGVYARGVLLSVDDSRIEGGTTGLHAKDLLEIAAKSATIAGGTSAIVYEYPSRPSLAGVTLEGPYSTH
jgi:uncharacterized Zn finger protein (UPF0148 family)